MLDLKITDFDELSDEEFEQLERRVEKLLSMWEIQNLRGQAATFHDDQHIGEQRRELKALKHPSFDVAGEMAFRAKAVVDSLEGNSLIHPLASPVIEVNDDCTKARAVWWSMGVEGLSKFREQPMAIISLGMVPGTQVSPCAGGRHQPVGGQNRAAEQLAGLHDDQKRLLRLQKVRKHRDQ